MEGGFGAQARHQLRARMPGAAAAQHGVMRCEACRQ